MGFVGNMDSFIGVPHRRWVEEKSGYLVSFCATEALLVIWW